MGIRSRSSPRGRRLVTVFAVLLGTLPVALPVPADPIGREKQPVPDREPPFEMPVVQPPKFPDRTVDIRSHGAVGDGRTMNTLAFAKAIAACAAAGGGHVVVPAGQWRTGPIHLESNIDLHIEKGAVVRFTRHPEAYLPVVLTRWEGHECYNYSPFIYARDRSNIAITGSGILDGQGSAWQAWAGRQFGAARRLYESEANGIAVKDRIFGTEEAALRPSFIQPFHCKNVLVEGVRIQGGPMWNIHPVYCENVIVRNVSVVARGYNSDAVVLDSCRNVIFEHSSLEGDDDCVALKSGIGEDGWRVGRPTENVIVRGIHTRRGHGGIAFGSDTSGWIRNVFVHDCRFDGAGVGIRIKSLRGRGGGVENVWVDGITMGEIGEDAVRINLEYGHSTIPPRSDRPPVVRNIHMKNVLCRGAAAAVRLVGLPEMPIENITLEDVTLRARTGGTISHVKRLLLDHVRIEQEEGAVWQTEDTSAVTVRDCNFAPLALKATMAPSSSNAAAADSAGSGEGTPR